MAMDVLASDRAAPAAPGTLGEGLEPSTASEWSDFILSQVAATDRAYLSKPEFLLGHSILEASTARDYAGRELLELMQNAADAAAEAGRRGQVRIELTNEALVVANTGVPFSTGGVRSLMTAHTSDKSGRAIRLIGAKGLGFRSILNWSEEPFITSGALEIAFSREHAARHVAALASRSLRLRELSEARSPMAPILPFPMVGGDIEAGVGGLPDRVIRRARELRTEGYDTVIAAAVDGDRHARALGQLQEFDATFLLFVDALEEVVIAVDDGPELIWSKEHLDGDDVVLRIGAGTEVQEQRWVCRRRLGRVDDTAEENRGFELAVAVRRGDNAPGRLHCWFPTDLAVPFPALLHATLDLDSHRKSLNADCALNDAVLSALAAFYAEFLADLAAAGTIGSATSFLARREPFPMALRAFEDEVYRYAAELPVVPTLAGKRAKASATSLGPPGGTSYMPRRLFGTMARFRSAEERAVLVRLGVDEVEGRHIVERFVAADLSLEERAAAVIGIAQNLPAEVHDRRLLVDGAGRAMTRLNTCFPPPTGGRPPTLPRWATARFLDPFLWQRLSTGLPGSPRDRFRQLQGFGVTEFSAEGVITSLRRQAAVQLKGGRADPDRVRRDLLDALHGLRRTVAREAAYPAGSTEVLCRDGQWRDASAVHLSVGYGRSGAIVQSLYAGQPDLLVAPPKENGLDPGAADLVDFMRWIGVQAWPAAQLEQVPAGLRDLVLDSLPDRLVVSSDGYQAVLVKADLRWDSGLRATYRTIVGLDGILSSAPSDAILAWLALDPRWDPVTGTPFPTYVRARQGRAQFRPYEGVLPDLVRAKIASSPWLLTKDGRRVAPREAMAEPGRLEQLFARPERPEGSAAELYGLDRAVWTRGLSNAGVPHRLGDLPERDVYRLLASLERRKVGSELVRRLYLQVLELDGFEPSGGGAEGRAFRSAGRLQVRRRGTVEWVSAPEARYADRDGLPAAAREVFALLDLPSRRSAREAEARFGVRPLSRERVEVELVGSIEAGPVERGVLRGMLAATAPFIKALRSAHSIDIGRLRRFARLLLVPVIEADLRFSIGERTIEGRLEPGRHLLHGDDLLIAVDPAASPEEFRLQAAVAISDGLAELFDLQGGDDFEKLLTAEGPTLRRLQMRRLLTHHSLEEIERLMALVDEELALIEPEDHGVDAETFARATAGDGGARGDGGERSTSLSGIAAADADAPDAPGAPGAAHGQSTAGRPTGEEGTPPFRPDGVKSSPLDFGSASSGSGGGPAGGRPGVRVGGATGALTTASDLHGPADAEQWALLFERSEGRHPIDVSRLQGSGAFGCDCLSFASSDDAEIFAADPTRTDLVARFVEVKSGAVRLTEHEVVAAGRYDARYYVYRITFDGGSRTSARLTIVRDPLSHKAALSRECEVRMDEVAERTSLRLDPVRL